MVTDFTGTLSVSGHVDAALGQGTLSGNLGVTLTASLDSDGTGSATETVTGNIYAKGSYLGGIPFSLTIPFDETSPTLTFQLGSFLASEPESLSGVKLTVTTSGTVTHSQTEITDSVLAVASGTYHGISFSGTIAASGTLFAPAISGIEANQTTSDTATIAPFQTVSVLDPTGQPDTLTVTLSDPANGALSDLDGGTYDAATGVYKFTGSAASISSALDGLVFIPTLGLGAAGTTVTTGFTLSVSDPTGASTTDTTATVVTTETGSPVVTAANHRLEPGREIAASKLFSYSDPQDTGATLYLLVDDTAGAKSGYFVIDGVRAAAQQNLYLTPSQLSATFFVAASHPQKDLISVSAFDGSQWSSAVEVAIKTV